MHNYDNNPTRFLVENIGLLPPGRVLDVAMGSGRNAVYLAKMGFTVYGVDISVENIANALSLARKEGVNIYPEVGDLENSYHIAEEDYDIVMCFNYLQRSLISQIKDGVRKGGLVVYQTFTIDQPQFGKPTNPNFLLKYNELLDMFRDFRCLRYHEGILDYPEAGFHPAREALAGIIAQKSLVFKEGQSAEKIDCP